MVAGDRPNRSSVYQLLLPRPSPSLTGALPLSLYALEEEEDWRKKKDTGTQEYSGARTPPAAPTAFSFSPEHVLSTPDYNMRGQYLYTGTHTRTKFADLIHLTNSCMHAAGRS